MVNFERRLGSFIPLPVFESKITTPLVIGSGAEDSLDVGPNPSKEGVLRLGVRAAVTSGDDAKEKELGVASGGSSVVVILGVWVIRAC